jgi:hypothetical protein
MYVYVKSDLYYLWRDSVLFIWQILSIKVTNISVSSPTQLPVHLHLQNICVKYSTEWA